MLLREWLECELLDNGSLLVALQRLPKPPQLVKHMLDEWLERYRRRTVAQAPTQASTEQHRQQLTTTQEPLSTDDETDDE